MFVTCEIPELAQILEQSSGTRQVSRFFFYSLYKTNRFRHVAVRRLVIDHKRRQNVMLKNIGATFLSFPRFDVIYDLLLKRRSVTWNQFVKSLSLFIIDEYSLVFRK